MLVVSEDTDERLEWGLTNPGLYHKLHGVHRPVAMKKSVIKRRKRVVPANNEPESNQARLNSFPVSPSATSPMINPSEFQGSSRVHHHGTDDHSRLDNHQNAHHFETVEMQSRQRMGPYHPLDLEIRQRDRELERGHQYEPRPIGVDFTGYELDQRNYQTRGRQPSSQAHPQQRIPSQQRQLPPLPAIHDSSLHPSDAESHSRLSPIPTSSTRKRSHSNASRSSRDPSPSRPGGARLSSISSILNHPQQSSAMQELPIDPNLSTLPAHLQQHRLATPLSQGATFSQPSTQQSQLPRHSTSSDPGNYEVQQKKERMRREAVAMREALAAKERELAELEKS